MSMTIYLFPFPAAISHKLMITAWCMPQVRTRAAVAGAESLQVVPSADPGQRTNTVCIRCTAAACMLAQEPSICWAVSFGDCAALSGLPAITPAIGRATLRHQTQPCSCRLQM